VCKFTKKGFIFDIKENNMKQTCLIIPAFLILLNLQAQQMPSTDILKTKAPERFEAVFTTTKGLFTIEVNRKWSPLGADRLYQLFKTGFYRGNAIFRVQKGYVVQFGISDSAAVNAFWEKHPLRDEPLKVPNLSGTLSYARDSTDTRTTQLFINLKDNFKLDTVYYHGVRGFPPVARIISGRETVDSLYGGYGFEPANYQDSVMLFGNKWLLKQFPELDFIIDAKITKE
jgi:peptidyl-prolyl cis-trans isomerase A (cyclophilin A)